MVDCAKNGPLVTDPLITSVLSAAAAPEEPPPPAPLAMLRAVAIPPPMVKKSPMPCIASNAVLPVVAPCTRVLPSASASNAGELGATMPPAAAASASIKPSLWVILSKSGIASSVAK